MKITYNPEPGVQPEIIDKYGEIFRNGETRDIDEPLVSKLLTCPYFVEAIKVDGVEVLEAPKKRTRRTKIQMAEANGEN